MKATKQIPDIQKAIAYFQQGNMDDANRVLKNLLEAHPDYAYGWFMLGVIHTQKNEIDAAIKAIKKAIKLQSIYPEAYNNLGVIHEKAGQFAEAKSAYSMAIKQRINYPQALYNLANIHKNEGAPEQAIELYCKAIKCAPDYANAIINLGVVYQQLRQYKKAIPYFEKALKLLPQDVTTLNNLGLSYFYLFDYENALAIFDHLDQISPGMATTYLNKAQILQSMGEYSKAKEYYLLAARIPEFENIAYTNLGLMQLANLEFEDGWNNYRYRKSIQNLDFIIPDTLPDQLTDKSVLVCKDQGLGDEIFFLRYIDFLTNAGAKVTYYTDHRLSSILQRSFKNITIVNGYRENKNYDCVLPVSELPRLLYNKTEDNIPLSISLIQNNVIVEEVRKSLPKNNKINIAVAWQAGTEQNNQLFKRIDPSLIGSILSGIDANILIIQRQPTKTDIKRLEKSLGRKTFNFSYVNENLEECLGLLYLVDELLTVSNTNVHLAAGLGKSAKIFVPYPPEWRWTANKCTSPWFPDFQIYRQENSGNWDQATEKCKEGLVNKFSIPK